MRAVTTSLPLVARIMAGTLGSYGLTVLLTIAASRILIRLGVNNVEAVTGTTLASFAVFVLASMLAFHARNTVRSWACLLASGLICWLVILALPIG